jgi:hypothetical protein
MGWFSRKSFKVALTGVGSGIDYEERGKRMQIECEMMAKPPGLLIHTRTMRWRPPHHAESISAEELERIKANVAQSLPGFTLKWE